MPLLLFFQFLPPIALLVLLAGTLRILLTGDGNSATWRFLGAWLVGTALLYSLATMIVLAADRDWDDPDSPSRLGSMGEPVVAVTVIVLSAAFALFPRRRAVLFPALISLPFQVWYWMPIF